MVKRRGCVMRGVLKRESIQFPRCYLNLLKPITCHVGSLLTESHVDLALSLTLMLLVANFANIQ